METDDAIVADALLALANVFFGALAGPKLNLFAEKLDAAMDVLILPVHVVRWQALLALLKLTLMLLRQMVVLLPI